MCATQQWISVQGKLLSVFNLKLHKVEKGITRNFIFHSAFYVILGTGLTQKSFCLYFLESQTFIKFNWVKKMKPACIVELYTTENSHSLLPFNFFEYLMSLYIVMNLRITESTYFWSIFIYVWVCFYNYF